MSVEGLMIMAIVLLVILIAGLFYLIALRLKKTDKGEEARLDKLSEALMEKLESQTLTEEQKARIAEALKELRDRSV